MQGRFYVGVRGTSRTAEVGMNDTRLNHLLADLDDARTVISDITESGSLPDSERSLLAFVRNTINTNITVVQAMLEDA